VCQPASGCHPNGGLCREDRDCCGAAGSGLPGDGNVRCEKEPNATIGLCRNPTGCNPQGNVCHYKDYTCSISSARNACCAAPGNSGECQLDRLGVPRCNGLGDTCRSTGETCSSSGDCCDDKPCVPDDQGMLRCSEPSCISAGGACTISGDCCRGSLCVSELGSTRGTCSTPEPTAPVPGGSGGAGGTGGGAAEGGNGAASGSGGSGGEESPVEPCAVFGQQCSVASDCCADVPCTDGFCIYPLL
jgi:hypothetical protein